MDYDPEFPIPSSRELEDFRLYFDLEREFMPNENYLESHRNSQIRQYAIRTIARNTEAIDEQFAVGEPTDLVLILRTPCKEAASKTKIVPIKSVPETDPAEEARLKRLWNFDLQWITTTDGCEDIPPLETQGTPAASTRDVENNRDTSDSFNMCVCDCDPRANMPDSLCNIM